MLVKICFTFKTSFSCDVAFCFYTLQHNSGRVLWYYVGYPCVCSSVCPSVCLSYVRLSVFLFPDDKLSKCQWIFTKLGACIDMEIWFGIFNGQILSIFDRVIYLQYAHRQISSVSISRHTIVAGYYGFTLDVLVSVWADASTRLAFL